MLVKLLLVVLLACVQSINSSSVPFITKCKIDDSKCLKTSAQAAISIFAAGIPEIGVTPLDPFFMKKLDASSKNLKLHLKDVTGTGLKQCIVKKIEFVSVKSKLLVKLLCNVDFQGQYEMDGNILILPIRGHGLAKVLLQKIQITAEVGIKEVTGPDGKQHWNIINHKHSYELKDKSSIELDNLFEDNEALAQAAKDLIKNNSNDVINEVAPPIVSAIVSVIVGQVKHFFKNVPLEDLILH